MGFFREKSNQQFTRPEISHDLSLPDRIERCVDRNAADPLPEVRIIAEISQRQVGLDKCFLHGFIGSGVVADHVTADAIHPFLVPFDQRGEGLPVASAHAENKFKVSGFVHGRSVGGNPANQ
jgi:hypothetical protein